MDRNVRMGRIGLVLLVTLASLSLMGCGNKSGSAALAIRGLFSKTDGDSSAPSRLRLAIQQRYEASRELANGQAWLARFALESGQSLGVMSGAYDIGDSNFSCTGTGTGIFAATPTSTDQGTLDIDCSVTSTDTFTCGGETFTFHSGTFGNMLQLSSAVMSVAVEFSGRMSGGDFGDNTEVSCNFAYSINLATLAANPEQAVSADCSNSTLSCTIDGEKIGCEDLVESMQENANASCS